MKAGKIWSRSKLLVFFAPAAAADGDGVGVGGSAGSPTFLECFCTKLADSGDPLKSTHSANSSPNQSTSASANDMNRQETH